MVSLAVSVGFRLLLALAPDPSDGAYRRSRVADSQVEASARHCLYWREKTQVTFNQNVAGDPALPGEAVFTAVTRSFQTWNDAFASCGSLTFAEGARVSDRKLGYSVTAGNANVNQVLFRSKKCQQVAPAADPCWNDSSCNNAYDCWNHDSGSIGVTTTTYDVRTGRIFDADIELNAANFKFSTADSPVCAPPELSQNCVATDVQNTVTHEVGHLIGLDHAPSTDSTMSAKATPGELQKRSLDPGTERAVCDIYPQNAASQDCVDGSEDGGAASSRSGGAGCGASEGFEGGAWVAWPLLLALRSLVLRRNPLNGNRHG